MSEWSFFKNGVCTGTVFYGTESAMLSNLPSGEFAVLGVFEKGALLP